MNVVVSTLYCGESQYEKCCAAISSQDYRHIHHNVIAFKDNMEAHTTLYRAFFEEENTFDLMIKVDADMVLANNQVVSDLVRPFAEDSLLDQFNVQVKDFFTNSEIFGIEVFRKGLKYRERSDFFVDRAISGQKRVLVDYRGLHPSAFHCFDPDVWQAYSFGVHRAAKGQDDIIALLLDHFRGNRHVMLAVACLGAMDMWSGAIKVTPRNYKMLSVNDVQERCQQVGFDQIEKRLHCVLNRIRHKKKIQDFLFRIIRRAIRVY